MRFFGFVAGFFRNHAPESSTRLVGILGFVAGYALASILIVRSCLDHEVTWTDIAVVVVVLSYAAVSLKLRSPFPPEMLALLTKGQVTIEATKKVEETTTTEVKP